ncbi:Hypothetical predicted protein [Podarcis lilfordi]|uniref:Uncharacterized protein n=1 Tax=Podarcis lilfordi TaxID=74358 RepID=A0AA35LF88_9SAUR|nr:Hypothetical predicted protein [Podarcis lilfordi]
MEENLISAGLPANRKQGKVSYVFGNQGDGSGERKHDAPQRCQPHSCTCGDMGSLSDKRKDQSPILPFISKAEPACFSAVLVRADRRDTFRLAKLLRTR